MKVTCRWGYFTGTKSYPHSADPNQVTTDEATAIELWEYKDAIASYLLSQGLPDTMEMRLANCSTTKERWTTVSLDYQAKSAYTQADLQQAFLEMCCAKGADVKEFLTSLCYKCEELAAAGVQVTDEEYKRTILRGIPAELGTFASQLLSMATLISKSAPIDLDALVSHLYKETDRLKSRQAKGKKDNPTDEALTATASDDGRRQHCKGKCHNCGKLGHWAKECQSPKKDREDSAGTQSMQAPSTSSKPVNKPVGSANLTYDSEGDGFWMATEEAVDRMHLATAEPDLMLGAPDILKVALHQEEEIKIELGEEEWIGAVITPIKGDNHVRIELYDLGAT
jgi:hypothetical protein